MSFFDTVKETALNAGNVAANKTKEVAEVAKLKNDIASQERAIKEAYIAIGKKCYEAYGDESDALYVDEIQKINAAKKTIEQKQADIADAKQKYSV